MTQPLFKPGFRLSVVDGIALCIGAVLTIWIGTSSLVLGIAIGFVVVHFFLFCNVLRMARPLELIWAAVFILLTWLCLVDRTIALEAMFGGSLLLTLVFSVVQLLRPNYHGVGWQRINPNLPAWWIQHVNAGHDEKPGATAPIVAPGNLPLP